MGDDICVAEVRDWADGLEEVRELIGPGFARTERKSAQACLKLAPASEAAGPRR